MAVSALARDGPGLVRDSGALERRRAPDHVAASHTTTAQDGPLPMDSSPLRIVREGVRRSELAAIADAQFGDMVKGVVDVARGILAIGGELHSDEEAVLLDDGSQQQHLWGINLYPAERSDTWIEFDSMINVRPSQGNRSRGVDDLALQQTIREVVSRLVSEG